LSVQQVVFDRDVLALEIPDFPKTHAERGPTLRGSVERCHVDERDDRQPACCARAAAGRAAEPRNELPPSLMPPSR
jgi:hypothetical protein